MRGSNLCLFNFFGVFKLKQLTSIGHVSMLLLCFKFLVKVEFSQEISKIKTRKAPSVMNYLRNDFLEGHNIYQTVMLKIKKIRT